MKIFRCALLFVVAILFVGCGVSAQTHEEVVQERDTLLEIIAGLESEVKVLQQDNESLLNDIQIRETTISTLVKEIEEYRLETATAEEPQIVEQSQALTGRQAQTQREELEQAQEELAEAWNDMVDEVQDLGRAIRDTFLESLRNH